MVGAKLCLDTLSPPRHAARSWIPGITQPWEGVRAHMWAHMLCARSSIAQDVNASMRVGVCVCASSSCAWLHPTPLAVCAARLFSLLLFLDCFFLLRCQHLIVSHPGNITAFSWQPHWCCVWDGGYVELQARGPSVVPSAYAFRC